MTILNGVITRARCRTIQMRRFLAVTLLVGIATLSGGLLYAQQPAARGAAGLDAARVAEISVRMRAFVEQGTIAGAVTLLLRHGGIVSVEAVGYRELETRAPMQADTIFQVRSMTKTVTAAAVMILRDERRLSIDDRVSRYLPEFAAAQPFTIRHLLNHTSGMPDEEFPAALMPQIRAAKTLRELVEQYARAPQLFVPGTQFLYSGAGYKILGRIVEVVSSKPFDVFVDERLFRPLGMTDSSLLPVADRLQRFATVYEQRDGRLVRSEAYDVPAVARLGFPQPSWSLFTTAADMAAVYQMLLQQGTFREQRILSRSSVSLMTSVQTRLLVAAPSGRRADYGLGLNIIGRHAPTAPSHLTSYLPPVLSPGSYAHLGLLGTFAWADPSRSLVGVFLIQRAPRDYREAMTSEERDAFVSLASAAAGNSRRVGRLDVTGQQRPANKRLQPTALGAVMKRRV